MTAMPRDPVELKLDQLHRTFQELKALVSHRGIKLRVLVALETASGQQRQWKLSTENEA